MRLVTRTSGYSIKQVDTHASADTRKWRIICNECAAALQPCETLLTERVSGESEYPFSFEEKILVIDTA